MGNNSTDILKRQHAGGPLRKTWEDRLLRVCGLSREDFAFCDLTLSDKIRENSQVKFHPRHDKPKGSFAEKTIPSADSGQVQNLLPADDDVVFLVLLDSDRTGVISMSVKAFNHCWRCLLSTDPDGFVVVDQKCENKFVLQILADAIDVAVWGSKWLESLRSVSDSVDSTESAEDKFRPPDIGA